MIYKMSPSLENELLNLPETGMGYQVVKAIRQGFYSIENYLVLNAEVVIEFNEATNANIRKVIQKGISLFKENANVINFKVLSVLVENQVSNQFSEPKIEGTKGANENQVVQASGEEIFVRLSAFDDDRRIDKVNRCLRAGSYTTTEADYLNCKFLHLNPIDRYALPNNNEIKFTFYIKPFKFDSLQRGIVQPANGKLGGGVEVYFEKGTSYGSFLNQASY